MTDIPVFTAADGIATLILHEIPARKEGYILVRAVFGSLACLLRECADFCRGAGAERVYAGGEADFSAYPVLLLPDGAMVDDELDAKINAYQQEITDFMADLVQTDNEFKRRFVSVLARLDEKDWELIEKMAEMLSEQE